MLEASDCASNLDLIYDSSYQIKKCKNPSDCYAFKGQKNETKNFMKLVEDLVWDQVMRILFKIQTSCLE